MENGKTQHIWILHIWCIFLSDDAITITNTYIFLESDSTPIRHTF